MAETEGIRVEVAPTYIPEQSNPDGSSIKTPLFVFAYQIRIINNTSERAKLLARHWEIVDGDGDRKVVEGDGVIGVQPDIAPGTFHQYGSFCQLNTDWGTMEGYFIMQSQSGRRFHAKVGRFFLIAKPD